MKTEKIKLTATYDDKTYQLRDSSQGKNIAEIRRLIAAGFTLDPIKVRKVESGYMIIDGFQRVEALSSLKGDDCEIEAEIYDIDHEEAMIIAAGANQKHGQQLEKKDKVKIAMKLLETFPKTSNREIADIAFLSEGTIRKYRKQVPTAQTKTRIGSDGREISVPKQKDKPTSKNKDLSQKNEAQLPGNHTEANSLEAATPVTKKAKPPSADKSSSNRKRPSKAETKAKAPPTTSKASSSKTISPKKGNKIKTTSSTSKTKYEEIDSLLGRYRDLIEIMEDAKSFVTQLKGKTKMSQEEREELEAFEALVDGMECHIL